MHIALYQPDIAANTGTIVRLAACLGQPCHIIEPAGFDPSDRAFRRAGLDYAQHAEIVRHVSFAAFEAWRAAAGARLLLLTARGDVSFLDIAYRSDDVLMLGRESAGAPPQVHAAADARLRIPIRAGLRSLNVAVAAAMVLSEALRQTGGFSALPPLEG